MCSFSLKPLGHPQATSMRVLKVSVGRWESFERAPGAGSSWSAKQAFPCSASVLKIGVDGEQSWIR